jgi:hypothetical protein
VVLVALREEFHASLWERLAKRIVA